MRGIGIDIGTTSICLAVYEEDTGQLQEVLREKNYFLEDTFRQDPDRIFTTVKGMLDDLLLSFNSGNNDNDRDKPVVIGISSQMHGMLYVNKEGRPVSSYYT